jgi:hypothetical protein
MQPFALVVAELKQAAREASALAASAQEASALESWVQERLRGGATSGEEAQ